MRDQDILYLEGALFNALCNQRELHEGYFCPINGVNVYTKSTPFDDHYMYEIYINISGGTQNIAKLVNSINRYMYDNFTIMPGKLILNELRSSYYLYYMVKESEIEKVAVLCKMMGA